MQRRLLRVAVFLALIAATIPLQTSLTASTTDERILFTRTPDGPPDALPIGFLDPSTETTIERAHIVSDAGWRAAPNGTALVLVNFSGLRLAEADGSLPVALTTTAEGEQHAFPAWSPNGDRIAFQRSSSQGTQVMIADAEPGSVPVPLTDPLPNVRPAGLDWSPDESIVWSWVADNTSGIELTSVAQKTTMGLGPGTWPRFSPDGTAIAFLSGEVGSRAIATMDVNGQNRVVRAQPAQTLAWSPDGTAIAWGDRHTLGVYDPDTSESRVLITGEPGETNLYVADWASLVLPTFIDVPYDYTFSGDIEWAATEAITKGCNPPTNDRFCPGSPITRGQLAAFLTRALDLLPAAEDAFLDDAGSIFEDDINRLAAAGITRGCNPPDNDRFCPHSQVTRGQMAAFLVRAFEYTAGLGENRFVDDDGSIFEDDIDRLGAAGVTRGCNPPVNDRYCPDAAVTRAQMAAFLRRASG